MDEWKTIEPNTWTPASDGDTIEGVLISAAPKSDVLSARYNLENAEGQVLVWGSAVLDERMQYVSVGNKVRITFKGLSQNKKGQPMKIFKVETSQTTEQQ